MSIKRDKVNEYYSACDANKYDEAINLYDLAIAQLEGSYIRVQLGYEKSKNAELLKRIEELEALMEESTSGNETISA